MATFRRGSRYFNGQTGIFRGKRVIFPRYIDYSRIPVIGVITIDSAMEYRPDLISLVAFRRPDLGWYIMGKNNISGVEELYSGRQLVIPQVDGVL